jgi:hypothetical protein
MDPAKKSDPDARTEAQLVCRQVRQALEEATEAAVPPAVIAALHASEALCARLSSESQSPGASAPQHGALDYELQDESYPPFGRQIDVRLYFHWNDYDPADEPRPIWGAVIDDVEVLAVRYFDAEGNVVEERDHLATVARDLLNEDWDAAVDACTEAGERTGMGTSHPLYRSATPQHRVAASVRSPGVPRMAPSARSLRMPRDRRKLG